MTTEQRAIALELPGRQIKDASLPQVLVSDSRTAGGMGDAFLPPGLLKLAQAYDLSQGARSATAGAEARVAVKPGQVMVIELAEGVSIITSAEKLKETLERIDPKALTEDGALRIDAIRNRGTATRGWVSDTLGELVGRVFTLDVGTDAIIEAAKEKARELARSWLGDAAHEQLEAFAEPGVSWLGTKALMWVIEDRLGRRHGLYRWPGAQGEPIELLADTDASAPSTAPQLEADAAKGPLLLFIHGAASSTTGSFGDLKAQSAGARADWDALEKRFGDRIYAFEHRTFSESPIENALALARALPSGARLSVVTHSRGGLVGDLLCLGGLPDELVAGFARNDEALAHADAKDRANLRELAALLANKRLVVERYVRVASPARGTRLASSNFDVFLSALLTLVGRVPYLFGNPIYTALKRIVIEIAKNRTRPHLVPGIEAMLPESPLAELLLRAQPAKGMALGVIAGDIEGGGVLKRLGVLFTDYLLFDSYDNDLVVDTDSMYAGLARPHAARRLFDQGANVSHFKYFENPRSRAALRGWLTAPDTGSVPDFEPLPGLFDEPTLDAERSRDRATVALRAGQADTAKLPVVVVLPGIMGSHLAIDKMRDRVWFDPLDIAAGGLERISWGTQGVEAEKLFSMFYGDLCTHLLASHRVERFPYDWRMPVQASARRLAARVRELLDETAERRLPLRLLAHSMGGLVVRAMIAENAALWDELMGRAGARFVMLGTPNQGSHRMVETLIGKAGTVRKLAAIDHKHELQQVLNIIAGFRGALQMLPRPGFADTGGSQRDDYFVPGVWGEFKAKVRDFWVGDGVAAIPEKDALREAQSLWRLPGLGGNKPGLPERHHDKVIYVHGCASNTACGVDETAARLKMIGTPKGDGSVTWDSGRIGGIGSFYYMSATHGELPDTEEHFPALVDLLEGGKTNRLSTGAPVLRGTDAEQRVVYDAGPISYPTEEELARSLLDAPTRRRAKARALPVLKVSCAAMDLRFADSPVMVGHYEQDPISGAEALIDRYLVNNELTMRLHLGLYAGAIGTATVVLLQPTSEERARGRTRGAVVAGLGSFGELTGASLTEAIRTATLRYLLQIVERSAAEGHAEPIQTSLSTLLLGYNSTANLSVEDSVNALMRGVLEANRQFRVTTQSTVTAQVTRLDLVECYLDTAIATAQAIQRVAERLNGESARLGMHVEASAELIQRQGVRPRLDAPSSSAYWPRVIVSGTGAQQDREDADADQDADSWPAKQEDGAAEGTRRGPARLAQRLKYVFLSQRARAETVVHQRQPGLIEKLVGLSVGKPTYQASLARTLFQVMVPHDFKEAARQMDRMVLVLDAHTASLPWELMRADDEPIAVRSAMVRQLSSTRYRPRVRSTLDCAAYVIGNPSSKGFAEAFSNPARPIAADPPVLPGAENEARAVVELLRQQGYQVAEAIGTGHTAVEVIDRLYEQPYRILHIAAHGEFDIAAPDGSRRSGVLLSDGLMITAAEIGAMEIVPDLVFLNCCHLGQVGAQPAVSDVAFNKLAYSIARELIEMGVRAVVAAGWAVDDAAARMFAETFYGALMAENKAFGLAVFEARRNTYQHFGNTNTWGAYQAYGDPGFLINPGAQRGSSGEGEWKPVAPEQLLDRLDLLRQNTIYPLPGMAAPALRDTEAKVEWLLERCPPQWRKLGQVQFALGRTFAELGSSGLDRAIRHYLEAISIEDKEQRVPVAAIEQLANLEARRGAQSAADRTLIERASARLLQLIACTQTDATTKDTAALARNAERCAILGGSWKRRARTVADAKPFDVQAFEKALREARDWYRRGEGELEGSAFSRYCALNRIALDALFKQTSDEDTDLARRAGERARERFGASRSYEDAVMPADAKLIETLLEGRLSGRDANAIDTVVEAYRQAGRSVPESANKLDSVVGHICLLARLFELRDLRPTGEALRHIANALLPGACDGTASDAIEAGRTRKATPTTKTRRNAETSKGGARQHKRYN